MSLNWKEIDLILRELPLENSHIQKINQPDFSSLLLQIYSPVRRFLFLIHLGQGETRLHATAQRPEKKVKLQRFAQFLRSRISGGRIIEAGQIPRQRIVKLSVSRGGEITVLWVRLWSNAANIIAVDEKDIILDAFYRRPKRGEISGRSYNPEKEFAESPPDPKREEKDELYTVREYSDESFNRFIDSSYSCKNSSKEIAALAEKAAGSLEGERNRLRRIISGLEKQQREFKDSEQYKQAGDLITSNLHRVSHGDRWLKTENYFRDSETIEIELDPALSPAENAESYYKKYRKAKSGAEYVRNELTKASRQLSELDDLQNDLQHAVDEGDPEPLRQIAGRFSSPEKGRQPAAGEAGPGLRFTSGGFDILAGRNAKENDALLRSFVQGNDYWLHARDYPGGYIFIKNKKGKSVPLDVLLDAGTLAVHYSKARKGTSADLYYTQVKYLRRAKHGKLGTVIPTQEKNLTVALDEQRLRRLLNQQGEEG